MPRMLCVCYGQLQGLIAAPTPTEALHCRSGTAASLAMCGQMGLAYKEGRDLYEETLARSYTNRIQRTHLWLHSGKLAMQPCPRLDMALCLCLPPTALNSKMKSVLRYLHLNIVSQFFDIIPSVP
jgi:hypothetical protein